MRCPQHALAAVNTYANGAGEPDESLKTKIVDLLADLMHLCDEEALTFWALVTVAEDHYFDEVPGGEAA